MARLLTARTHRRCLVRSALIALCLTAVTVPAVAEAYTHSWSCLRSSGSRCTDFSGQYYNPWISVAAYSSPAKSEVCAKGETQAGNQRSILGDPDGCSNNTTLRISCFNGSTPDSQAYVYWGGAGGSDDIAGSAETPATDPYC